MAKQKYYYAIARKDNGNMPMIFGQLPIFWSKDLANHECFSVFGPTWKDYYTVQKISVSDLETIILKSKKA